MPKDKHFKTSFRSSVNPQLICPQVGHCILKVKSRKMPLQCSKKPENNHKNVRHIDLLLAQMIC